MHGLQYGSLTGATAHQYYPQETEVLSKDPDPALRKSVVEEFLRVHDSIDSTHIASLITGVIEQVENYTGIDTTPRTKKSYWGRPAHVIAIPGRNTSNVTNVVALDHDGTETPLTHNVDYYVTGNKRKKIRLNSVARSISVEYDSGYAVDECPAAIIEAIKQEISLQYKSHAGDGNQASRLSVNNLSIEARHLLIGGGFYEYSK